MEEYVLEVSNDRPVRFRGEMLSEVGPPESIGKFSRWHELRLYKTERGKFVLEIVFRSLAVRDRGDRVETDDHFVVVCGSAKDVDAELERYDPLEFLVGFPEGVDDWERKQRRLEGSVTDAFEEGVGRLLLGAAQRCPEFAEEV